MLVVNTENQQRLSMLDDTYKLWDFVTALPNGHNR